MSGSLRQSLIWMFFAFGILVLLAAWQAEFVLEAVQANIMLNGTILCTFAFGAWLSFKSVISLKNEELAFAALKEMHEDVKNQLSGKVTDPLWRHYRCNELAVVFKKPEVMTQAFQLLSDKLSHGREIDVDSGTLQTLVESIQVRLDEKKSLTQFVSGILVLLGLIGTFIGLMLTLSSVGKILGEMNLAGDNPTEAVSQLMTNLQVPLQGMAIGFSSSLFGLITSLTLSLMVRFSGTAFSEFSNEFESWLGNIVASVSGEHNVSDESGVSRLTEERQLALIMRTARVSVSSNARLNDKMGGLIKAIDKLSVNSLKQSHALENVLSATSELQQNGRILTQASRKTLEGIYSASANLRAKEEIVEATIALSNQLETRDSHLVGSIQALEAQLQVLRQRDVEFKAHTTPEQQDIYALLQELKVSLKEGNMNSINDQLWGNEEAPEIVDPKQDQGVTQSTRATGARGI